MLGLDVRRGGWGRWLAASPRARRRGGEGKPWTQVFLAHMHVPSDGRGGKVLDGFFTKIMLGVRS